MKRLALLLLLCTALAGCGVITDMADLQTRLTDAGYTGVSTNQGSVNGVDRLEVRAAGSDPRHSTDSIAELVWETYPQRLDQVSITLNEAHEVYKEEDLRAAFGARGAAEKAAEDVSRTWLIVGVVVFLLFLAGLVGLIVFLVRRSRRQTVPPQYPPQYPPPGWTPQ